MPDRRFPPPCTFDEANHACFIVRDANRFPVAYAYFELEPGRRAAGNLMTKDEARKIAAGIARLPELVRGGREGEQSWFCTDLHLLINIRVDTRVDN
jgi:hypothetical protein